MRKISGCKTLIFLVVVTAYILYKTIITICGPAAVLGPLVEKHYFNAWATAGT
jgi:hypothetical protein